MLLLLSDVCELGRRVSECCDEDQPSALQTLVSGSVLTSCKQWPLRSSIVFHSTEQHGDCQRISCWQECQLEQNQEFHNTQHHISTHIGPTLTDLSTCAQCFYSVATFGAVVHALFTSLLSSYTIAEDMDSTTPKPSLVSLPLELRNQIYKELLYPDRRPFDELRQEHDSSDSPSSSSLDFDDLWSSDEEDQDDDHDHDIER